MSLKYTLLEAHLTPALNDYIARVQNVKSNDMSSIIERMVQKGSTLTKTDLLASFNLFSEVIIEITKDGETVNTDLFKTNLSVQGTFDNAMDGYDTKRHNLNINMQAGAVLKDAIAHIAVEKVSTPDVHPHVLEVKDAITKSISDTITSGGAVEIIGSILKVAGKHAKNGIYFVDSNNKAHKATTLVDNKPARLIVIVPVLAKGDYTLHITTQYNGGGGVLKTPRTGIFNKPLTIQ